MSKQVIVIEPHTTAALPYRPEPHVIVTAIVRSPSPVDVHLVDDDGLHEHEKGNVISSSYGHRLGQRAVRMHTIMPSRDSLYLLIRNGAEGTVSVEYEVFVRHHWHSDTTYADADWLV